MTNHKIERLASDISRSISDILLTEARDDILKSITITGCKLSNDLGFCKVYFTSLIKMAQKDIEKEVNEAASFIRGRLSERIDMRHTPVLKFVYDTSIQYGEKIEKIIKDLK